MLNPLVVARFNVEPIFFLCAQCAKLCVRMTLQSYIRQNLHFIWKILSAKGLQPPFINSHPLCHQLTDKIELNYWWKFPRVGTYRTAHGTQFRGFDVLYLLHLVQRTQLCTRTRINTKQTASNKKQNYHNGDK